MAEAAVTCLLEQVKEVVKEYKDLTSGGEYEFHQLTNELGLFKAFLHDAAMKTTAATKDPLLRERESQIREVVYEVEDTIDIILTKAYQACRAKRSGNPLRLFVSKRFFLAKEVNSIRKEKLLPLFNEAKKFATMQIADGSGAVEIPSTKFKWDKPITQNRLLGFDDLEWAITGRLLEETSELDVISIIGVPGLGKTTLAWKIFQKESICYHFPTRIWLYIPRVFNRRDAFLQILKKIFTVQDMSNLDDHKLAQIVRSLLEKEKFLLVLDDVWSVDAVNEIKQVLPLSSGKAKVLITSREGSVGMHSSVFRLQFLTEEESWTLLQYKVFGNLEDCPHELRAIGKRIAIKCDGVPLIVVLIGGILLDQLMRGGAMEEWEMVSENVSGFSQNDKLRSAMDVVELSYTRLPDYLRECFLYLGVFPEDYDIPVKTLFGLWIAEGFIQHEDGRSLEECAEEYMNDLIRRNLLNVEKTNHMGKVKTCRVHDMIRALCITKSYEQNLFEEIKQSKTGELYPPVSKVKKLRRLILNYDLSNFLSRSPNDPHVRSFFCFYEQYAELKPEYISAMLDGFPLLRTLEFKSIKLHQFPSKFMKLIHLRYLTLYADNLTFLPEAISQLWNLQTLVAETGSHSITMKANIWKMIQLRHLSTNAAAVLDAKWEGEAGQNLQTLNRLSHESCTEAVSKKAKNLKTLGIYGKLTNVFRTKFLEKLHHLENLKLVNSLIYEATASEDLLHGLPQWNCSFPPNLKRLTLANTFLDWRHMSTLATIKSLEALKLKDNAFVGVSWNVGGYDFPNLQLLLIVNTDLLLWEASTDTFPSLRYLVVKNCENLEEIPECLGKHLEKLEIERLCDSAVESARRIEQTRKGEFAVEFNLKIGPGCETE